MDTRMIDVAIGLALVFALTSMLVTALQEIYSSMTKLRGKVLYQAIISFVGDDKVFAQALLDIAQRTGVAPACLVLEITESQLLDESLYAMALDLKNAGFVLSIDDFGTGHSSLVKLKRLPVSELKIDKEFVRDIVVDPNDREICATVNALARALGLEVVAEGVETQGQQDILRELGCDQLQGFLYAKPMSAANLQMWALGDDGRLTTANNDQTLRPDFSDSLFTPDDLSGDVGPGSR